VRPILRTIRQRPRRARKAQVAAVATTLVLLLVVTYLSNYLVFQLPDQMGDVEFQHLVLVENQMERLQATINAQAARAVIPLTLTTPVSLGSLGVPPFGPPAQGTLASEPSGVGLNTSYELDTVAPEEPNWGVYSACLPAGKGTCSGNGVVDYANFSGNGTTLGITISGSSDSLVYNLNGNNDTITLTWSGPNSGPVVFVVNGSYDKLTLVKSGSDTTSVPTLTIDFFGDHEQFLMNPSGSHQSAGGATINVDFIGSLGLLCPYGNISSTDKVGTLSHGGTRLNLSIAWWNADGYATAPDTVAYPGGTIATETLTFQNETGFVACPFLQIAPSIYQSFGYGGIDVHLSNLYQPPDDIAYENGAVLLSNPGEESVMVSGPNFTYAITPSGLRASLTFIALTGNVTTESGVATSGILTKIVSVSTSTFGAGVHGLFVAPPYYVNLTTEFPAAWLDYFSNQGAMFPNGAVCIPVNATIPSGYSCDQPPPLTPVEVSAELVAQSVTVTTILVAVGSR
jgi:hypothetical protein